jgi:hypothetical protein
VTSPRSPRERWGTCCPFDPYCDHSYLADVDLMEWMDRRISDDEAIRVIEGTT